MVKISRNWPKSVWKCPKYVLKCPKSALKCSNQSKNVQKYPKSAGFSFKILFTAKNAGYTFKILLLVSKPTGHEVPRCRNNLQLWSVVLCILWVHEQWTTWTWSLSLNLKLAYLVSKSYYKSWALYLLSKMLTPLLNLTHKVRNCQRMVYSDLIIRNQPESENVKIEIC